MVCPAIGASLRIRLRYTKHVCLFKILFLIYFSEGDYVRCGGETYDGDCSESGQASQRNMQALPTFRRQST